MATTQAKQSGFTSEQIFQYYNRISLPSVYHYTPETASVNLHTNPTKALEFLSVLQKYQLTHIPFENLALHYSPKSSISTDASVVFDKTVTRRRGGYCMENTLLLYHILLGLGFNVYATGGRVYQAVQPIADRQDWVGAHWNHMLLILTLSNSQRYLLDVGFSNMAPVSPVPLEDNYSMRNSGLSEIRLFRPRNPAHRTPDLDLWEYQIRFSETADWVPAYCFSEVHFTAGDFAVMSFYTSVCEDSWFTTEVVAAVMVLDEKEDRIVGDVTLFREECKKRVDGESEVIAICSSEEQRVEVIEEQFGIVLSNEEKAGIRGRVSALQ